MEGKSKYDYEKCKELAKKCTSRKEFKILNSQAYHISVKNKWIDDFLGKNYKTGSKYTYEKCEDIAKYCKGRTDFQKMNAQAYAVSLKNGWLESFFGEPLVRRDYYTYEICKELSKKYKSRVEFYKSDQQAYAVSLKNGWLESFFGEPLVKPDGYYTYDVCKKLSMTCNCKTEFQNLSSQAYYISSQNGWLDDFFEGNLNVPIMEFEISGLCLNLGIDFVYNKATSWSEGLRPDFLLPNQKIIIECQGKQHFENVDFWGGKKGLELRIERDKKKKELCEKNGFKVIYFANYKYNFPYEVITKIDDIKKILESIKND